jgi:hypothetical protein
VGKELRFKPNMVFNLAVGFQDVPLSAADTAKAKGAVKAVKLFSMLLADTVRISESGLPDVLTKAPTAWNDISYTIKEDDDSGGEEDGEGADGAEGGSADEGVTVKTAAGKATVLKSRLRERTSVSDAQMENKAKRADNQARLHAKAMEKGLAKFNGTGSSSSSSSSSQGGGGGEGGGAAEDFHCFESASAYPYEAKGSALHVDMEREVLFLPIGGVPVPFHISTVKNVAMPEPEAKAAYLRLNFYTPGQVRKEAGCNVSLCWRTRLFLLARCLLAGRTGIPLTHTSPPPPPPPPPPSLLLFLSFSSSLSLPPPGGHAGAGQRSGAPNGRAGERAQANDGPGLRERVHVSVRVHQRPPNRAPAHPRAPEAGAVEGREGRNRGQPRGASQAGAMPL